MRPYIIVAALCCAAILFAANLPPYFTGGGGTPANCVVFPGTSPAAYLCAPSGAAGLNSGGANQDLNLTPSGTGNIRTSANLGIGSSPISTIAGRSYVTIKGSTLAGVLELATAQADANSNLVGMWQSTDANNLDADRRIGLIQMLLDGTTANHRGGLIRFATKADSGGISVWAALTRQGFWGFGGNLSPAYSIDATGDTNTSGVYRVGGTAGSSASCTFCSITSTGGIITSISSGTDYPGVSAQTDQTASRAIGNVYQNTTGHPMWVMVTISDNAVINTIDVLTDGSNPPTTNVGSQGISATNTKTSIGFWVLNNNYYKVTVTAGVTTLNKWTEWN